MNFESNANFVDVHIHTVRGIGYVLEKRRALGMDQGTIGIGRYASHRHGNAIPANRTESSAKALDPLRVFKA